MCGVVLGELWVTLPFERGWFPMAPLCAFPCNCAWKPPITQTFVQRNPAWIQPALAASQSLKNCWICGELTGPGVSDDKISFLMSFQALHFCCLNPGISICPCQYTLQCQANIRFLGDFSSYFLRADLAVQARIESSR